MKKGKTLKRVLLIVLALVLLLAVCMGLLAGKYLGWFNKGNTGAYSLDTVKPLPESPLRGMNIIYLGSSVTDGMQSKGVSFVEYLSKRNGSAYVKEAVSGTTLVDTGKDSYVQRMLRNLDPAESADAFVCQLSTNDAQKGLPMGAVSDSKELGSFDTATVCGAMEYIICYAQNTWNCPVVFYTGTDFGDENYVKMIDALYRLQEKWGIGIIDLYRELPVNSIDSDLYNVYMNDPIHPTRRGYLEWWTPAMETYLYEFLR